MTSLEKVEIILSHIKKVESHMQKLAKLYLPEDKDFALGLLQRSRTHDVSKFDWFEFDNLWPDSPQFEKALKEHREGNSHHVEYHKRGLKGMSNVDIAEMVCDCFARSNEFGTDIRKWFEEEATKRYGFEMNDEEGKYITEVLDLLLSPKF